MLVLKKIKIKRKYYIIIPMVVMLSIFGLYGAITLNNQRISDENYHPSLEDLGEPIENPTIPTIEYVKYWLFVDKTSKILYVEGEWECGDFSDRLDINAKERIKNPKTARKKAPAMYNTISPVLAIADAVRTINVKRTRYKVIR